MEPGIGHRAFLHTDAFGSYYTTIASRFGAKTFDGNLMRLALSSLKYPKRLTDGGPGCRPPHTFLEAEGQVSSCWSVVSLRSCSRSGSVRSLSVL
jgi:hypothetical protein